MTHDWQAIKARNPILDVVGRSVTLRRRGQEHIGLCPFHNERTPSFHVVPDKEFAHCFGCGWHGDVVDFVAAMNGGDSAAALASLSGGDVKLSDDDRAARKRYMAEHEAAQCEEYRLAGEAAARRWDNASPVADDHPYLARKQVPGTGLRQEGANIILPIYDSEGNIQTVQAIAPDGGKLFHRGARAGGGRLMVGIHFGRTIVCEGYATGASIYEALPDQVCVTFSKANMSVIARELASRGTHIVLAADSNAASEMTALAAELDCPVAIPEEGSDFNDQYIARGPESVSDTILAAVRKFTDAKRRALHEIEQETAPADLWARHHPPELPEGLLPPVIETFARTRASLMGVDPAGIAMAALTVCGAVIRDCIKVKVKPNENWTECARLWTMLIGDPSYKKSPIMRAAAGKISAMDGAMLRQYNRDFAAWKDAGGDGDPPAQTRLRIEDITMEAAQEVCAASPDGVLALQDELSGWFGGIEKYSSAKGSAKDRSFWLRAFGGGEYAVNRISRKSILIDNLSISILGGVQPDPIRRIMSDATDDGLIQRFFPIVLRPSTIDSEDDIADTGLEYEALVERLHEMDKVEGVFGLVRFSEGAGKIRRALAERNHRLTTATETFNKKLSAHVGKYDGLFPRLALIFHCIEAASNASRGVSGNAVPEFISEDTARRASAFLQDFLMRHATAFYFGVIGLSDDHEHLHDIGGYILTHKLDTVTMRTLERGSRGMRKLTREEGSRIFEQLEAMGWLEQTNARYGTPNWKVNPKVHEMFEARAADEKTRRRHAREAVAEMIGDDDDQD